MTAPAHYRGLTDLVGALARGEVTSRDTVIETLNRIEASASSLNAFRVVRGESAVVEAEKADWRIAAGVRLPLLGVPIAVKDDSDVTGMSTSFGCGGDFPPKKADSEVVRRLRTAGAVIVGKTNMPELGQWPFTDAPAFGYTRNPWNGEHTPGGSSGGSAAAVAAGLVPAALGSDGGGSIRIPAAWTNLVGIKPQRGRVSPWPYIEPFHGLTVIGPLARTVADAALLLDVVSGSPESDTHAAAHEPVSDAVGTDPGRLRIALALSPPITTTGARLHPDVRAGVLRIASCLRVLGHEVIARDLDYGLVLSLSVLSRLSAGVAEQFRALPGARVEARTRAKVRHGRLLSGPVLRAARAAESLLHKQIGDVFGEFDVVLAPTTSTPPPPVHAMDGLGSMATERMIIRTCPYTFPWNALGWPSVNIPAGFTDEGLPVGAQLMGPAESERLLVAVAAQLEAELHWDHHYPEPWWGR
ncbi:amidase [Nocardia arizonensis]|uniref:amidase n=1 Tax=Nocardia arizonensis TaxID=1141647 RepID=UPI0006D2ACFF|nr:amidase [Nocardia arizonensis]